ncbi:MAG: hypothetical protein KGZ57_06105 [Dethiobacter sp.]|nr:hypothetical protein [Dethiobacter sp.]
MSNPLGFNALTDALASVFDTQFDSRQANKTRHTLSDAGLAAFSVFFIQSPSFLAYQRDMEKRNGWAKPWVGPFSHVTIGVLFRFTRTFGDAEIMSCTVL